MQLVISEAEHAILENAVNGAQRYGIATIAEMGVEDANKIRITVPSNAELKQIISSNAQLQDTKLHHILCAAIAREAKKDAHNIGIKLRGDNSLPPLLIQDVVSVSATLRRLNQERAIQPILADSP
eukprot:GHVP01001127.1.p1 GENE.GHVP01001127.1~~GHVP01001127.1.p1  ORF type:complete len:126 (+),score=5.11 GHVP01001127.1:1127-1504(+)